jgi:two-component system, cell cycle sensor histidine kinase and response regulator CckA
MPASKIRALVVDDDRPTAELMAEILREAGYDVTDAANRDDVARVAECGDRFDVAILDVVMPSISGDEVARRLRQRNPSLKILFVTGFPGALFQSQPMLWDGEAFLEKPCTDRGLVEAVSLLLTGHIEAPPSARPLTVGSGGDADIEPVA